MKQLLFFVLLCTTQIVIAQTNTMNSVLKNYLDIKNELVAGNTANSKNAAVTMKQTVEAITSKNISADEWKAFSLAKAKLVDNLAVFIAAKDISKQRELFSTLSDQMIQLAKATSLSATELYVDYCPMKKVFWLSTEKDIRNPYYGSMMLSCGNIKETIKH